MRRLSSKDTNCCTRVTHNDGNSNFKMYHNTQSRTTVLVSDIQVRKKGSLDKTQPQTLASNCYKSVGKMEIQHETKELIIKKFLVARKPESIGYAP